MEIEKELVASRSKPHAEKKKFLKSLYLRQEVSDVPRFVAGIPDAA